MTIAKLRESTGFKLIPLQLPTEDAFLGFVAFAFSDSTHAKAMCDQFVQEGGLIETHNAGDLPAAAGKFIDWLIVKHWGEEPVTDKLAAKTAGVL